MLHSSAKAPSASFRLLYDFNGTGSRPSASLISVNGTLYGTTAYGGTGGSCGSNGCGTVFSLTTSGKERVLYTFSFRDGESPSAGLIDVNGTLYGTTIQGGEYGDGTVFALIP
jgi:uncharacterized repeat protein (TIGR03803 family)